MVSINLTTKTYRKFAMALFWALAVLVFPVSNALNSVISNGDSLELFGIGTHEEKRNDIYLGAIFAPNSIDSVSKLIDPNVNKRMSFKFLSNYSNRKMSRLLKQRIAMNNSKNKWRPFTQEIIKLSNLFKRSMQAGDELNIDYVVENGTEIYLNRTLFLTIEGSSFYELVLNMWFGSIPPTESFKAGINGGNTAYLNDQLVAKYESLQPVVGRFDIDKITEAQITSVAQATSKTKTQKISNPPSKKSTPAPQGKPKVPVQKKKTVAISKKEPNDSKPEPIANKPIDAEVKQNKALSTSSKFEVEKTDLKIDDLLAAPLLAAATLAKTDNSQKTSENSNTQDEINPSAKQSANLKEPNLSETITKPAISPTSSEQVAKLDIAEDDKQENDDFDLIYGSYTQEIMRALRSKQAYPKKAMREGVEGDLVVLISLNKVGELIESKITARSGSRILDRGVLKMLRKVSPYPAIPVELNLEKFEMEVPLSFKFSD